MVEASPTRKRPARKAKSTAAATKKTAVANAARPMSDEHKRALAVGREEGRAIRSYLEAVEANRPKRGRRRTPDGIRRRLEQIERDLPYADPLTRVHLTQERIDLQSELDTGAEAFDLDALEEGFAKAVKGYSERKASRMRPGDRSASTRRC
jgi:hypothetical protein